VQHLLVLHAVDALGDRRAEARPTGDGRPDARSDLLRRGGKEEPLLGFELHRTPTRRLVGAADQHRHPASVRELDTRPQQRRVVRRQQQRANAGLAEG
jgi:hypothetical protein